jgi:hypothetical protein
VFIVVEFFVGVGVVVIVGVLLVVGVARVLAGASSQSTPFLITHRRVVEVTSNQCTSCSSWPLLALLKLDGFFCSLKASSSRDRRHHCACGAVTWFCVLSQSLAGTVILVVVIIIIGARRD